MEKIININDIPAIILEVCPFDKTIVRCFYKGKIRFFQKEHKDYTSKITFTNYDSYVWRYGSYKK